MLIAYLNLDEVIRIVRTEDQPKPVLIKRFKLSDEQAEAILETKLRHLARLEEMKIREEQKKLAEERDEIDRILKSKARLTKLVREELLQDAEEYGDARRTKLVEREAAQAIAEADSDRSEPTTVVLSRLGWVRAAKGHDIDARALVLQERRRVPGRGQGPQPAAGGVHRFHRPRLQPRCASAARRARLRRAACRAPSILRTARPSPRC